jgi:hypothetical protein
VVSEIPISVEYIPAYDAWNGKFVMLPVLKMIHHQEQYKVKYEITYSDRSKTTATRTVDKATYEEAKRAIAERGE